MMGCRDCGKIKPQIAPQPTLNLKALISKQPRMDSNGKPLTSLRWNPTPEQLFALEELYRCGTRTPSAQQIQQITSHLRQFGKIEGKNVFYWFQNHKARERQRRSREIKCTSRGNQWNVGSSHDKISEIGLRMTNQEFRQAKTWILHSKSSNTIPNQESWSMSTPAMAKELRRFRAFEGVDGFPGRQTPWKSEGASRSPANPNIILVPSSQIEDEILLPSRTKVEDKRGEIRNRTKVEDKRGEIQTLQLFPLEGSCKSGNGVHFHGEVETTIHSGCLSSSHFFEFLPLKL